MNEPTSSASTSTSTHAHAPAALPTMAFIGGGNMASAVIGGLLQSGHPASALRVVEPYQPQRDKLQADFGLRALPAADASLADAQLVIWAVKPQSFREAAPPVAAHTTQALHLSVMAGIRSEDIARAVGSERVVRAMPNTPALIGMGITGLFARPSVNEAQRALIERVLAPTGRTLWVGNEVDLDAVTALSGSGPAYVFYVIEALVTAAEHMGLSAEQGKTLALATFAGATELASRSSDSPAELREKVTSKGGTTHAALTVLQAAGVQASFVAALQAAQQRAKELGDQFGAS